MPSPLETTRTPTWPEAIANAIDFRLRNTHVMLPGKVLDYDTGSQTATILPALKSPIVDPYGNVVVLSKPPISHVPIMFPSGGGMRMTFPLQAGDYVSLVFSDQSLDIWKSAGGEVDSIDLRIHDIGDCVAFPGLHPDSTAWTNVSGSTIQIGKDGSSASPAATNATFTSLMQAIAAISFTGTGDGALLQSKLATWASGSLPGAVSQTVQILG